MTDNEELRKATTEIDRLRAQKHDLLLTMAESIERIERVQAKLQRVQVLRNAGILR